MSGLYTWNEIQATWELHSAGPSASGVGILLDTINSTACTLAQPTSPVSTGTPITLSATVKAGATVVTVGTMTFDRLGTDGKTWVNLGQDTTGSPWTISHTTPATAATWKYRARYLGSGVYAPSTSTSKSVTTQIGTVSTTWSGYATGTRSYVESGGYRGDYVDSRCYHGYYSSSNGQQKSAIHFSVPSNVKSSDVTSMKLRLTRVAGLGDTNPQVWVGTHTDASLSSTWSGLSGKKEQRLSIDPPNYSSSADQTVTFIMDTAIMNDFQDGARGILLGPRGDTHYCAFRGVASVSSSEKPWLEIKYTYRP